MKIKDIVKNVATFLNMEDVVNYCTNNTTGTNTLSKVNSLVNLANLVITELCVSYIPLMKKEEIELSDGKIFYADLSENVIKVNRVFDENGEELFFKAEETFVETKGNATKIEYSYYPTSMGLTSDTGYSESEISSGTLAYGVAAEYCLTESRFDEAVMWRKRFEDIVFSKYVPKSLNTKSRRWE